MTESNISSTGRAARLAKVAGLSARTGGKFAQLKARQRFASVERKAGLEDEFRLETAEAVAETLGNMKGALMKLGQMASYVDQGLPEPVREVLAGLQHDAPPMSPSLAAGVIENELGAPPNDVFATWDSEPIAAASIGQVHRAITHDGRAVAVKVQYPGVDEAIGSDLATAQVVFGGLGRMFNGLEPGPIVEELRDRIVEELDYRLEAENQRTFADFFAGHPFIEIPAVVDEFSSRRVLTTELSDGVTWDEMTEWQQDEKDLAAETIYRFAFGSLYRLNMFNGDPHPGNYLFHGGGRVTFLDFGLVKKFAPGELDVYGELISAMVLDRDIATFRATVERAGLLKPGLDIANNEVEEYFRHFYDFVLEDGDYTIDAAYASATVRRIFDVGGAHAAITQAANIPPPFVVIQRINMGLLAIFGELNATNNWRSIAEEIWPFVNAPSRTEMGREISKNWP